MQTVLILTMIPIKPTTKECLKSTYLLIDIQSNLQVHHVPYYRVFKQNKEFANEILLIYM